MEKTCLVCGQGFVLTGSRQTMCPQCYPIERSRRQSEWQNNWRTEHPEESKARQERWRMSHPDRVKASNKSYYAIHPEKSRVSSRAWVCAHPEEERARMAERRALGHVPLNSPFPGCEGHHINQNDVIYIPKEPHHSIWHNQWTGQGMSEINALAGQYLTEDWT